MDIVVGKPLPVERYNDAPVGTHVHNDALGHRIKTHAGEAGWTYAESPDFDGGRFLSEWSEYIVISSPGAVAEEKDPVGDLAKELWTVRADSLIGTKWEYTTGSWTKAEQDLYRALAEFVLNREPVKPSRVRDKDDDLWEEVEPGLYGMVDNTTGELYQDTRPSDLRTLDYIEETYGIRERIA